MAPLLVMPSVANPVPSFVLSVVSVALGVATVLSRVKFRVCVVLTLLAVSV